ncbi:MAG: hypothetical protein WCB22_14310, partial [Pseudolabrys sp.]
CERDRRHLADWHLEQMMASATAGSGPMRIDVADVPTKRWTVRATMVAKRLMTTTTPNEGQE